MTTSVGRYRQVDDPADVGEWASTTWETVVTALPRAGIAVLVLAAFMVVGRAGRPLVRSRLARRHTPSFARVFARLTASTATAVGFLLGVTILFPSVRPVDVLASAGVLTIAVGFAFQDILQNLLAGVLLLFRQPFRGGDQIQVGDVVGTVDEINIRETVVMTFDGRKVLVPNATVYTDVIRVQTARERIRASFTVGIAYESDLDAALAVARHAVSAVEGVGDDPPPEALCSRLAESTVDLEVMVWCDAHQLEMRRTLSRCLTAVKSAFDRAGIEMPTRVVALQATSSFEAALGGRPVTPGGAVARSVPTASAGSEGAATAS
jgi:small conductance mechanosensitive channel